MSILILYALEIERNESFYFISYFSKPHGTWHQDIHDWSNNFFLSQRTTVVYELKFLFRAKTFVDRQDFMAYSK